MKCTECTGRVFLDRTYSDNASFEVYCLMCGDRKFINRSSELGQWLNKRESARQHRGILLGTYG